MSLQDAGKLSESETEYRAGVALSQNLANDFPATSNLRVALAFNHLGLGDMLAATGRPSQAEAEYRAALSTWQKLADDNLTIPE
jgi:hypothetical protein